MAVDGVKRGRVSARPNIQKRSPARSLPARRLAAVKQRLEAPLEKGSSLGGSSVNHVPTNLAKSRVGGDWLPKAESVTAMLQSAKALLQPDNPPPLELVGPPAGSHVAKPGTASLIGLPDDFFDPKASYEENVALLQRKGLPRFALLTKDERAHETQFADAVQADPKFFVEGAEILAHNTSLKTSIFEVDAMKRTYPPYGTGARPGSPPERSLRLTANHALHPTAVAIARLAFLKKLDELEQLPPTDPHRQVFVTNGGVAAGKGSLNDMLQHQEGEVPFGATWDSAGEGDSRENAWLLEAVTSRGLSAVFGYASADAMTRYEDVLRRQQTSGRVVDVMTFTNSYVEGARNMKAFLDSAAYRAAASKSLASAFVVKVGLWDEKSHSYPQVKVLGAGIQVKASLVPDVPSKQDVLEGALHRLEEYAMAQWRHGHDATGVIAGAFGADEKFVRSGAVEQT